LKVFGIGPSLISNVSPAFLPKIAFPSGADDVISMISLPSNSIVSPPAQGAKKRIRLSRPSSDSSFMRALSRMGEFLPKLLSCICCRRSLFQAEGVIFAFGMMSFISGSGKSLFGGLGHGIKFGTDLVDEGCVDFLFSHDQSVLRRFYQVYPTMACIEVMPNSAFLSKRSCSCRISSGVLAVDDMNAVVSIRSAELVSSSLVPLY